MSDKLAALFTILIDVYHFLIRMNRFDRFLHVTSLQFTFVDTFGDSSVAGDGGEDKDREELKNEKTEIQKLTFGSSVSLEAVMSIWASQTAREEWLIWFGPFFHIEWRQRD